MANEKTSENVDRDVTSSDLELMIKILSTEVTGHSGRKYMKSWQPLEFIEFCKRNGIPHKACMQGIKLMYDCSLLHCSSVCTENKEIYSYRLHITER